MRSLRRALLAYILCGVALVVLIAGIAVFMVARTNFRAQLDKALLDRANTVASLVTEDEGVLEFEPGQPMNEATIGAFVRISADDGAVIAQSDDWPSQSAAAALTPKHRPTLTDIQLPGDEPARAAALARFAARSPYGISNRFVIVEVIGRTQPVRRAESSVLTALIVGGLFAITCSALAVWLGIRRGLRPVRELSNAVDDIETEKLVLPARPGSCPDELRPIVGAVEGLLERLRGAMERERRFTDAAAHELRTPIAELKTITDVADRWPEPQRLHRSVKDVQVVVRQMEGLLESLLAAARGSAADGQQAAETMHLMPLARTVSQEAIERTRCKDVSWSFAGDDEVAWHGPPAAIIAIVRNLIDNAAEYTPTGGTVRVRTTANHDSTAFEVENGPVSLTTSEVDRMFEPFWRADGSRSDRNHRGLGLTIVESLARIMNLDRDVAMTPDGGLRVRLSSKPRHNGGS